MASFVAPLLAAVVLAQAQADRPAAGAVVDDETKPIALAQVVLDAPSRQAAHEPAAWRYVLPGPGDAFEHAPFRALILAREKPDDLVEAAHYRGEPARRRYTRIRFGSPASTRVTVVVDALVGGDVDLYVDADRNLKIDDRDRVAPEPGSGRALIWRLPLAVALLEQDSIQTIARAVVFRLGASGQTLGFAAAGYLEGTVILGGAGDPRARTLAARRVDGDGNGLLADAQDRIGVDLNGDGRFDPVDEQFLYASVLNLAGSRYIVLSDLVGSRLAFTPLSGTGTLRLALSASEKSTRVQAAEMQAMVISRDGSAFAVTSTEAATVPAGEYRLASLTCSLDDSQGGERWSFVFSDNITPGQPRWYKVGKDAAVTIDPIGKPRFAIVSREQSGDAKAGEDFVVRPALYTGDGLLIIVAYCGNPIAPASQELLGARIALVADDGQTVTTVHSGFS